MALPASRIDGNEFVKAAQAVGLPTTRASLNRIVNLVNQGMTPSQAARQLANSGKIMPKRGGTFKGVK